MNTAFVDFLGVTFRCDSSDPAVMRAFAESLIRLWFGAEQQITEAGRGVFGYKTRLDVEGVGLIAYGGNENTVHLEITGTGCAQVKDWSDVAGTIRDYKGRVTRIDLAADDFTGQTYNIEWCKAQYAGGGFKPARGASPVARMIDDQGSRKGCTYYVGSRQSGKMFRGYEKGREQGDPDSPWFRVEVEFHSTHRESLLPMLEDPSAYLAGSYACLASAKVEQKRIRTVAYSAAANLDKALEHAKKQAGRALHAMLTLNGGDICGALSRIYRPEFPKRLAGYIKTLLVTREGTLAYTEAQAPAWYREAPESDRLLMAKARSATAHWWRLETDSFGTAGTAAPSLAYQ